MTSSPPTIRDIARAAGVHHATVSRVLNNHPRISAGTRQRVQEAVRRLGYRPHPLVTALMQHRTGRRPALPDTGLALLVADRAGAAASAHARIDAEAIRQRASERGFFVEVYHAEEYRDRPEHLARAWRARGIVGMLVDTLDGPPSRLDLAGFACASVGNAVPGLPTVQSDHFAGMLCAWRAIRRLGYRRPGLYLHRHIEHATQGRWTAAFLLMQQELPVADRLPVLIGDTAAESVRWAQRHRPDVVLNNSFRQALASYDTVALDAIRPEDSGIDQRRSVIASTAVDLVAAQLSRNERGVMEDPLRILVPGHWVDGATCRGVADAGSVVRNHG